MTKEDCKKTSELVVCFGELLIDFVPTVGGVSLAEAPAFKKAPGGAPANVAVGISRLGGSSAFIGKVYFSILCLFIQMVIWFLVTTPRYSRKNSFKSSYLRHLSCVTLLQLITFLCEEIVCLICQNTKS